MTDPGRFLPLPAVVERVCLSRAEIYRRISQNAFPKPVKLSNSRNSVWVEREVIEWQLRQIEARDAS